MYVLYLEQLLLPNEIVSFCHSIEQLVSHEDGNNCGTRSKLCLDAPAEETSSGIGKINQIKITDIFPGRQHGEDTKHTLSGILIYRCGFCNRVFSLMQDLEVHILTHVGGGPYTCEICQKNFTKSKSLMIHMRRHTGHKPFKCEVCNKYFTRKDNLLAHKLLHFGEKRYICEVCEKSFLRMQHLNAHMHSHTRRKARKCELCSSEFTRIIDHLNHMCIHLNEVKWVVIHLVETFISCICVCVSYYAVTQSLVNKCCLT